MIQRLLLIATALLPLNSIAQCTDQVIASYSPTIVCSTRDVLLTASNVAGATYSWAGPNSFNAPVQNPTITAIPMSGSGDYVVTATVGTCEYKDTITITVNPTPSIPIIQHNSPVCEGDTLTMSANITASNMYFYWVGPDNLTALTVNGQTINLLNATVAKSGVYKVITEVPATGCRSDTAYANMVVNPNLVPNVFITADDTTITGPMVPIIFTANVTNAGTNPTYQWQKNSVNIPGATSQTYTGINGFDFQHQDTIGVVVSADASDPCPQTTFSNRLIVRINLGVDDYYDTQTLALYPNPNNGRFRLAGMPRNEVTGITVLNAVGQVVYASDITSATGNEEIVMDNMPDGVYLLQARSADGVKNIRFTYER